MASSFLFVGHEISVQQGKAALSPSIGARASDFEKEQEKRPIMNGRPLEKHGLPVHLFHRAFSHFQHTLTDFSLSLTTDDYRNAHEYISVSAALYASKQRWQEAIVAPLMRAICFDLVSFKSEGGAMPDGSIMMHTPGKILAPGGLFELKNEIGTGNADPAIQGPLSYRKVWVSDEVGCVP